MELMTEHQQNDDRSEFSPGSIYIFSDVKTIVEEGGRRVAENKQTYLSRFSRSSPIVSVITVVYNGVDVLQDTIDSVLKQKYNNIEYIIIDGGSDDGTLDVIHKNLTNIDYYLHDPDGGVYEGMNRGIRLAQGDYICLINAGDLQLDGFIEKSIQTIIKDRAELSFCRLQGEKSTGNFCAGLLIYHMNVNHQTFMVSKDIYFQVGAYAEKYRVVSDIKWARDAYKLGVNATFVDEALIVFGKGGLSDGKSSEIRQLIIKENTDEIMHEFSFLTEDEAETIYLFRFNKYLTGQFLDIAKRYAHISRLFKKSMGEYFESCLLGRINFQIHFYEVDELFPVYIKCCEFFEVSPRYIDVSLDGKHRFQEMIDQISMLGICANQKKVVLHYLEVFNRASETFIFDVVNRINRLDGYISIVLCDIRELENERKFEHVVCLKWSLTHPVIRKYLYQALFKLIKPYCVVTHFMINGVKLYERLGEKSSSYQFLHMMHGIDVFLMNKRSSKNAYREFVLDIIQKKKNHHFTTPSKYLKAYACRMGLDSAKISILHNTVDDFFYKNRKINSFYRGEQPLKILSIGRLVEWKGHGYLLDGVASFYKKTGRSFNLSIVYGRKGDLLVRYQKQCAKLGISEFVEFIDFVNFRESPNYLPSFDLFVLPSTYSNDGLFSTETFGVSTLEAIASGLTVIVSDAGASREIIECCSEFPYGHIIKNASGDSIAEKLEEITSKAEHFFSDNRVFAQKVFSHFSEEKQLLRLQHILDTKLQLPIKVALFTSDIQGGAGGAAYRCHQSFLNKGIECQLYCRSYGKLPDNSKRMGITSLNSENHKSYNIFNTNTELRKGYTIFTIDEHHISNKSLYDMVKDVDVISLHWTARFLSLENIAFLSQLGKPLVLTIRDMFYLTGGCHYFHGCQQWMSQCLDCPQLPESNSFLVDEVFSYKVKNWNMDNITLVTLSDISMQALNKSSLFVKADKVKINNGFAVDYMLRLDKYKSRTELGLPEDKYIILYIPSYESKVKGRIEALQALKKVAKDKTIDKSQIVIVTAGTSKLSKEEVGFDVLNLGFINGRSYMSSVYSIADITLIPSLEETFSNTCAESMLCGTPVVGFKAGAIPEMVINGKTGYLAESLTVDALASAIIDAYRISFDSIICRDHILNNFSLDRQADAYKKLFLKLTKRGQNKVKSYIDVLGGVKQRFNSQSLYASLVMSGKVSSRMKFTKPRFLKSLRSGQKLKSGELLISLNKDEVIKIDELGILAYIRKPTQYFSFQSIKNFKSSECVINAKDKLLMSYDETGNMVSSLYFDEMSPESESYFLLRNKQLIQRSTKNDGMLSVVPLSKYI